MFHVEPDRRYRRTATRQNELALAGGTQGIADTLRYMNQAVDQYKTHPKIRELALQLTRGLQQKDYTGEARKIFDYVQKRVRYVRDINGVETLQTPLKTLEYGAGDCDDKAMLLSTLLQSLGHNSRFVAVGTRPGVLSHVAVEDNINGNWVNLETTEPVGFGWAPPYIAEHMYGDQLDGLDGFLSKIWGGVKSVARKVDKIVVNLPGNKQAKALGDKIIVSKAGQAIGTVLSFIPATSYIGIAIKVAGAVKNVNASESAGRKIQNTINAQKSGNIAAAQQAAQTRYVYDQSTQLVREATATDVGQQQYVLNPTSGQLEPASAAQISATTPGSTVNFGTAYPLPYAAGGYQTATQLPQVQFQAPGGGLTTVAPIGSTSTPTAILKAMPWLAIGGIVLVGVVLLKKSNNYGGAKNVHGRR